MLAASIIRAMSARHNNPENNHLHTRRRQNLKSHILKYNEDELCA
jgi:hypothetical protein